MSRGGVVRERRVMVRGAGGGEQGTHHTHATKDGLLRYLQPIRYERGMTNSSRPIQRKGGNYGWCFFREILSKRAQPIREESGKTDSTLGHSEKE